MVGGGLGEGGDVRGAMGFVGSVGRGAPVSPALRRAARQVSRDRVSSPRRDTASGPCVRDLGAARVSCATTPLLGLGCKSRRLRLSCLVCFSGFTLSGCLRSVQGVLGGVSVMRQTPRDASRGSPFQSRLASLQIFNRQDLRRCVIARHVSNTGIHKSHLPTQVNYILEFQTQTLSY